MFDWHGKTVPARLVSVHDSDTCRAVFDTGQGIRQIIVRIYGIDGPELNSKDSEEKRHAVLARNELLNAVAPELFSVDGVYDRALIEQKLADKVVLVTLKLRHQDKYGRTLADVETTDGSDVARRLLDNGSVHAYFGKTKEAWSWPAT